MTPGAVAALVGAPAGPSAAAGGRGGRAADALQGGSDGGGAGEDEGGDGWAEMQRLGLAALMAAASEEGPDEGGDGEWRPSGRSRNDIILVASLIDKVPNLAGLARTCEVFGAGRLVLSDLSVARDPSFAAVSVTAEQWLPLEQVPPALLLPWLERRAAEGYTLVGLEQTAESVALPDYRWPARAVLVLGREKEGMPQEVLSLLDVAVEIPQLGIIRSLNVHVSGAIALYEYTRQRLAAAAPAARWCRLPGALAPHSRALGGAGG